MTEPLPPLLQLAHKGAEACDQAFLAWLAGQQDGAALIQALQAGRDNPEALTSLQESELLLALAPHLDAWLVALLAVQAEDATLKAQIAAFHPIALVRRQFVQRRAVPRHQASVAAFDGGDLAARLLTHYGCDVSDDTAFAEKIAAWLAQEAAQSKAEEEVVGEGEALALAERYAAWAAITPQGRYHHQASMVFAVPQPLDPSKLVHVHSEQVDGVTYLSAPEGERVVRTGFALTDPGGSLSQALAQTHYCIKCHRQGKDSCRQGLRDKESKFRDSAHGVSLTGCPLEQKISESHVLKEEGFSIGALAMIMVDNPLLPATGYRICNACMKACIYQKQQPVDIPLTESRILRDVLHLPWGVELYALLTQWNPLNLRRPVPKPTSGYRVLVVGQGPAGFNLAYHLLQEGHAVVAVDGLKIEPAPLLRQPIREVQQLWQALDERVVAGFGGVAEYGITVRWDKNFLSLIRLVLERHSHYRLYGGVRLGSQLSVADSFAMGFDHVALCLGAGRPTTLSLPHGLAKGVRLASDFLMSLQLTSAAKLASPANLQLRLPVVVIGGGLTAIDTATEALAYYPVMVEKFLSHYEQAVAAGGLAAIEAAWDEAEQAIAAEFIQHAQALRAARVQAQADGEVFDPLPLLQQWGGVTLVYRRDLTAAPAYRLNHEEVQLALAQGIRLAPNLTPVAVMVDSAGHASALQVRQEGGVISPLPAHSILIAAGTQPNTVLAMEEGAAVTLAGQGAVEGASAGASGGRGFAAADLAGHPIVPETGAKPLRAQVLLAPPGMIEADGRRLSVFGDLHPGFAGNVVGAMASAKRGYPEVGMVMQQRRPEAELGGKSWQDLVAELDDGLVARVVRVERLTPTIVEVVVRAPMAARHFQPGQFFRLQNFETTSGTAQAMEPLAMTGAWVDQQQGLVAMIALEMGGSSNLCAQLQPGEAVVLMGPTGTPTEIVQDSTVLLIGGGLGNAVLFSIGQALRAKGCRVLYAAGYKNTADRFRVADIEQAADVILWCCDQAPGFAPNPARPQDRHFVGNIVDGLIAYGKGELGEATIALGQVERIIAIGSDRMMAAVAAARHGRLSPLLSPHHQAIGSINSPMQCMMKQICGQCVQRHVDPATGLEQIVFSCTNQDQALDAVDFSNLADRLAQNRVVERVIKPASPL
jgi:NADPH-dependent glutamate synthase beta subunit-like oxidoreductase/NAD(P)H-flavin reductase